MRLLYKLSDLTRKGQPKKINWEDPQEQAFQTLKSKLANPPILQLPDFTNTFVLRTDASNRGLGAILMKYHDDLLHLIAYASRKLSKPEQNYSAIEKECLAIIWAIGNNLYLFGCVFIIQTDHKPLTYINQSKCLNKHHALGYDSPGI